MNFSQPTPPYLKKGKRLRKPSQTSRVDPLQGTIVLGRYRINSKLSQGGMSTVYLARNFEKGGLFAVKVLLPEPLAQLVWDCMSKKPWDRPLHMGEVLERLSLIDFNRE